MHVFGGHRGGSAGLPKSMQNNLEVVRIDIDTNRALQVLTGSVFAGANESIRELIANAADSLLQLPPEHRQSAQVRVLPDELRKTLAVRDSGVGMDRAEAREFLGKLFSSSKRPGGECIGRFGVGFYSCLRLCSRVEVFTRSRRPEDRGTRVTFGRGDTMELSTTDVAAVGTTVVLHLVPEHHNLLQRSTLRNLIRKYCNFIPFPIFLGDDSDLANEMHAPWEARRENELIGELQRVFNVPPPLAMFQLPSMQGTGRSRVSGVLLIGDRDFKPSVHLYASRVLITDDDTALLPSELRSFVAAFVNFDDVPLVLSRDAIMEEAPPVIHARHELVAFCADSLAKLARERREDFAKLQTTHGTALKQACCRHEELRERLCEHLTFRSTQRPSSTLPAYLKRKTDRAVIYADNMSAAEALLPLYERANVEVLFMCDAVDRELRQSWPAWHPPFKFRRLDAEPPGKSQDVRTQGNTQISASLCEQARQLFRSTVKNVPQLDLQVKSLGPDVPAAILAMNEEARKLIEVALVVRELKETGRMSELPEGLRAAAKAGLVEVMARRAETLLILNVDQSSIKRFFALLAPRKSAPANILTSWFRDSPAAPATDLPNLAPLLAQFFYEQALLASGLPLPRTDRNAISRTQSALVSLLLSGLQPEFQP